MALGAKGGPPRGDAVWFTDAAALGDPAIADRLARLSLGAVFVPAGRVAFGSGTWSFEAAPPPPAPVPRGMGVLVVSAGPELSAALAGPGSDFGGVAAAVGDALAKAAAADGPYGKVIGVHLDFPFTSASAGKGGDLVDAVRRRLPPGTFVSIAAAFSPATEEARKALAPLVDRADALAAPVFGSDLRVDASALDGLRRPWWAQYSTGIRGTVARASGAAASGASEASFDALAGNPKIDFENDLSVPDASFGAFHLVVRAPVKAGGLELETGDRIAYRVPALTEMLYQLGSTMAGKRYALGRLVVFDGSSESQRIFPVAAFEDVVLGRGLAPSLETSVRPAGRGAIAVEAVNGTVHASIPSRTANWIEIDVAPAHPADVALGGFDRYATYDGKGVPVTPGRASRVRLFETIVLPGETISPARIVLRGAVPARCCRWRSHLIAAAGPEQSTDWTEPPIPPTPTRAPAGPRKR